jgi:hypothetical protein
MLLQKNGKTLDIQLEDYKYAPEFDVCLFSLMKAIEKGWTLSNEGTCIVLKKKKNSIKFDCIMKMKDGMLCGVELLPRIGNEAAHPAQDGTTPESESGGENSTAGNPDSEGTSKDKSKQIYWNINQYHKVFGHASEDRGCNESYSQVLWLEANWNVGGMRRLSNV